MALYRIEFAVEWNEHARRAWRKRREIARYLSKDGTADLVDASEVDLLGMHYSVVAGDIVQAAVKALALVRGAFAEAGVDVNATDIRVTLQSGGLSPEHEGARW